MNASILQQDPHRVHVQREKVLEVAIGREIRAYRRKQEITVAELSATTGLSIGMLSKIENGNTSPSLTTLQALSNALSVPLTAFFRSFEEKRMAVHTKAGEGVVSERAGSARRALADVGLDGPEAAIDIHDLRTLLESLRAARRTAWQTAVRLLTTGLLLALIAGVAVRLKLFG